MRILTNLFLGLLILLAVPACVNTQQNWEPTKVFYVRHAQTVANATDNYTPITETTFSDSGIVQVAVIDSVLKRYTFDKIIVSPTWRTQHTIYPYLVSTHQQAEIWSDLTECCWQEDTLSPPTVSIDSIPWGNEIINMDTLYFKFKTPAANHEYNWETKNYRDGINQCRLAADSIHIKYGGKGLNILLIGHYCQGQELIKMLTGKVVQLPNASLGFYMLEQKDGSFIIQDLNTLE